MRFIPADGCHPPPGVLSRLPFSLSASASFRYPPPPGSVAAACDDGLQKTVVIFI